VVSAIHTQGGDVLKLIGDGILAIFTAEDRAHACAAALTATVDDTLRHAAHDAAAEYPSSCVAAEIGFHQGAGHARERGQRN